jgi:hypothetical protein
VVFVYLSYYRNIVMCFCFMNLFAWHILMGYAIMNGIYPSDQSSPFIHLSSINPGEDVYVTVSMLCTRTSFANRHAVFSKCLTGSGKVRTLLFLNNCSTSWFVTQTLYIFMAIYEQNTFNFLKNRR